ncbi:MAG: tetratricopeptide repeat protein [Bacteroidaceae bacterium]|nr:tetratricopeptide repeat protein [Bacteroidaceae bacterium]
MFILFMLVAFVASCNKEKTPMMDRAESMMDTYPDSALKLMESVKVDSLPTAETRARYSILMAMARDKNDLKVEEDSSLRNALCFYEKKKDRLREAQAHFYLSVFHRDKDERALEYEELCKALQCIPNVETRLGGLIYSNRAYMFLRTGLFEEAIVEFRREMEISEKTGDDDLYADAICQIGYCMYNLRNDSAIGYLRKGYDLLEKLPPIRNKSRTLSHSCAFLGQYYMMMNMYDSIEFFARRGLETSAFFVDSMNATYNLAYAMAATGRLDSASLMLHKLSQSPYMIHKQKAYRGLSDIETARGNASKAWEYERLSTLFYDTLVIQSQSVEVLNMVKKCKLEHELQLKEKGRRRTVVAISFLVLMILLLALYYLRRISQHKIVLQSTQLHLEESKGEAERQNQVIQTMQERMDKMDAQLGELDELERKKSILIMERRMMVQEKLEEVEAYQKLLSMVNEAEKFNEVHTRMEEMDWTQLMRYVDSQMDNICLRLFSEKGMKQDEVNFCILLLLNFSHINMANIMNCTRSAIYKRERYILQHRFGITDKDKRLKDVLMEMAQEKK